MQEWYYKMRSKNRNKLKQLGNDSTKTVPTSKHTFKNPVNVDNEPKRSKRYSFHPSFREAESRASTPSSGVKRKLFGLLRLCQTETSHRAQRLTAAHKKKRQQRFRAFFTKNIKVLQVFNKHTYAHNQAKRHQRDYVYTNGARSNVKCHSFCSRRRGTF